MQSEYNQVPRRKVGSPSIIIWSSSLHLGLRSLLHTAASAFLLRSITHFASPYSLTHASLEFSFILATISHNISRSFICVHVVYIAFLYLSQHFHLFKVFCFPVFRLFSFVVFIICWGRKFYSRYCVVFNDAAFNKNVQCFVIMTLHYFPKYNLFEDFPKYKLFINN